MSAPGAIRMLKPVDDATFRVPGDLHVLGELADRGGRLLRRFGDFETRYLEESLASIRIDRPVFICGLARSGSTILLEILASLRGVGTHRYRDFPFLQIPYFWNRWLDLVPGRRPPATERTHLDGIRVTPESPEAMEEPLWMLFFPDGHAPGRSHVMPPQARHPEFERFFRDHLRKLLLVRRASRYAGKGNYNLTRLGYLLRLFPDARFVLPVRDPLAHIASLQKQHALFSRAETGNPRMRRHLDRAGHFEFGLGRRAIDVGDGQAAVVEALWRDGRELEGWARYWASIHAFAAGELARDALLRERTLVMRYEDLCADPAARIRAMAAHADLPDAEEAVRRFAPSIQAPSYYRADYSAAEIDLIRGLTREAAARFGYPG